MPSAPDSPRAAAHAPSGPLVEAAPNLLFRALGKLRPSHEHSAYSATLLLVSAQMLSRVFGYLRDAYIAWKFGADPVTDVYYAAFQLPDYLYYVLAGGAISAAFVPIYSRYLAEKREAEAQRVFSVILTVMMLLFLALTSIAEIWARPLVQLMFPRFMPEQVELCVLLTRILLPMQLLFYVGMTSSAVLQTRRLFLVPAVAPIIYTLGIILGGITLSSRLGIASLAVGAVAGAFAGPFLMNVIGASRAGMRYRPALDLREPGFREWIALAIPLMLGVSLGTADEWIMRWFASGEAGAITLLNYAKRLFYVPYGVLGLAVGVAGMTFFSRLYSEKRLDEFAASINGAVYRAASASFLLSSWLVAAALPAFDLVMRRGKLVFVDSEVAAVYLAVFSASLAFWTAQTLYQRAFYATRDTVTPMIAATSLTFISVPAFDVLYRAMGTVGLAVASDIGILAQAAVLAWLLHRRELVDLREMPWGKLVKALTTSLLAAGLGMMVARAVPLNGSHLR